MISWLTSLFSKGATELVGAVGGIIDELHTSDEEKLTIKARIEAAVLKHNEVQMQYISQYDQEITKRHETDMKSDSWLSKNIRPMVLLFLTVATVILAYTTIFILDVSEVSLLQPWLDLLTILLVTVYAFYFGSRGIEKVQKIRSL
jgi:hypothetical protein